VKEERKKDGKGIPFGFGAWDLFGICGLMLEISPPALQDRDDIKRLEEDR
jgi:hypothetical protein